MTRIITRYHDKPTVNQMVYIQGRSINIHAARILYYCIHCLEPLEIVEFGLKCSANHNHYGFIHKDEARLLTQEERFMKIGDMFPSEYWRSIDILEPITLTIKEVKEVKEKNHKTQKLEKQYIIIFKESPKKLVLGIEKSKSIAVGLRELDPDGWAGKRITLYNEFSNNVFGKEGFVVRGRAPQPGDKTLTPEKPMFETPEALLGAIYKAVGLDEKNAKAAIEQCGFNGFKPSTSREVFSSVKDLVMSGAFVPLPEPDPDKFLFYDRVIQGIPFFGNYAQIDEAMDDMSVLFDPKNVDFIFEQLDNYANEAANNEAAAA